MSFLIILLVVFAINFGITTFLSLVIDNPYLVQMLTSIVISLVYAIWTNFRIPKFYKTPRFYTTWLYISAVFIAFDMLMNFLL